MLLPYYRWAHAPRIISVSFDEKGNLAGIVHSAVWNYFLAFEHHQWAVARWTRKRSVSWGVKMRPSEGVDPDFVALPFGNLIVAITGERTVSGIGENDGKIRWSAKLPGRILLGLNETDTGRVSVFCANGERVEIDPLLGGVEVCGKHVGELKLTAKKGSEFDLIVIPRPSREGLAATEHAGSVMPFNISIARKESDSADGGGFAWSQEVQESRKYPAVRLAEGAQGEWIIFNQRRNDGESRLCLGRYRVDGDDFQSIVIKDPGESYVTVTEGFVGENARLVRVEGRKGLVFVENRSTGDIVAVLDLSGSNRRIMLIDDGEHVDTRVLKE